MAFLTIGRMDRVRIYAWLVILAAACAMALSLLGAEGEIPPITSLVFWILILAASEFLPVSLGFGSQVTMAFPIYLAIAILFPPWAAMTVAGLGSFDARELRGEVPLHRALFNHGQNMLAVGGAAAIISLFGGDPLTRLWGVLAVVSAAIARLAINLGLVATAISLDGNRSLKRALLGLFPQPAGGFWLSYLLLTALGVVTAYVYETELGAWAVTAILIPLLFARLSLLGARAQQELSERVQHQQEALLEATERVFQERENERHRIAEEIHDGSLQLLAAASYGAGNANEFLKANRPDKAVEAMVGAGEAVDAAIKALRESLVDLRRSSVEQGGLMETVRRFADQVSVLWGTEVEIEGTIKNEPPIPVALAAFQILQEGLTNAMKHARAGPVTVRIGDDDGMVHIVVEDRGPGFDPETEVGTDHVGMRLMRERAERVGGRIELDTSPSSGTRLEAILPGGVAQ
jgi:signal transduction histidine kinase